MKYQILLLTIATSFLLSCGGDSEEIIEEVQTSANMLREVWVHDLANNENSNDLRVVFDLITTNDISDIQILISKEIPANVVNLELLSTLSDDSYTTVPLTNFLSYNVTLKSNQVDSDGDLLKHDETYFVYLYSQELNILNKAENPFLLSDNKVYNGSYKGQWNDALFGSTEVSIIFTHTSNDTYRGPTYISSSFTPTYGGVDDGKTTITIIGNNIETFQYLQDAPNYRNGCPGTYDGTGTVDNSFNIEIDFTGDDCDGYHADAQFSLKRVWKI